MICTLICASLVLQELAIPKRDFEGFSAGGDDRYQWVVVQRKGSDLVWVYNKEKSHTLTRYDKVKWVYFHSSGFYLSAKDDLGYGLFHFDHEMAFKRKIGGPILLCGIVNDRFFRYKFRDKANHGLPQLQEFAFSEQKPGIISITDHGDPFLLSTISAEITHNDFKRHWIYSINGVLTIGTQMDPRIYQMTKRGVTFANIALPGYIKPKQITDAHTPEDWFDKFSIITHFSPYKSGYLFAYTTTEDGPKTIICYTNNAGEVRSLQLFSKETQVIKTTGNSIVLAVATETASVIKLEFQTLEF